MQYSQIKQLIGTLIFKTSLHIGAGDTEMRIGGSRNPVVKNPLGGQPFNPGPSLKGKIRSLLEWKLGRVAAMITNGRPFSFQHLSRMDTPDTPNLLSTEAKSENSINRTEGVAGKLTGNHRKSSDMSLTPLIHGFCCFLTTAAVT